MTGIVIAYGYCIESIPTTTLLAFVYIITTAFLILSIYVPKTMHYNTIICSIMFIGFGRMSYDYRAQTLDINLYNTPCIITGLIKDIQQTKNGRWNQVILLSLNVIKTNVKSKYFYFAKPAIMIYNKEPHTMCVGDTIELQNITLKNTHNQSFGLYLMKEGACTSIFAEKLAYRIIKHPLISISRFIHNLKYRIYTAIQKKCTPNLFTFFSSLFLGNRTGNKYHMDILTDQHKHWGILHYLARSGLHLVLFTMIWNMILRLFPLAYRPRSILLAILVLLYYLLSWSSISFIRALILYSLYTAALIHDRIHHFYYLLILTCGLILLANPAQLFFVDFQLSFLLTFALAWLSMHENHKHNRL